jgi:hypothetical protein
VLLKPKVEEHQRIMQSYSDISREIKLSDGGLSFLDELPPDHTELPIANKPKQYLDVMSVVMTQFDMKQSNEQMTSCFN